MAAAVLGGVAAVVTALGGLFGGRGGHETVYVDRTDPTLVNQVQQLTASLETQRQVHESALAEYATGMRDLERKNLQQSEEMQVLQQKYNEVAELEAERAREAELLRNYPPQPFQQTEFWKRPGTVHIGVVGHCGIGKSTFVNTFRGLKKKDPGAAKVDHGSECTREPTPYEQQLGGGRRMVLWDLPGCGTPNFPTETYLRDVGIRYFNYMILLTAERPFMEGEVKLMNEMTEHNVPFAMVRGRIDSAQTACVEEEDSFEDLQREIRASARSMGINKIYLICNFLSKSHMFDFPELLRHIQENLRTTLL